MLEKAKQAKYDQFANTLFQAHACSNRIHVTHDHGRTGYFICPCRVSVTHDAVRILGDGSTVEIPIGDVTEFEFIKTEPEDVNANAKLERST